MQTITQNSISQVILDDATSIQVTDTGVRVGEPLEYIIGYLNSSNCEVHTASDVPQDWEPSKYMFDGSTWSLNSDWVDPLAYPKKKARALRDSLLAATDWTANSDVTMSDEMRTYRQALRDVPSQAGFPRNVTWPDKP